MTFSTMAAAFHKAGYQSPEPSGPKQQLEDLMARAIARGGGSMDPSCDEFVRLLHEAERAPLHWTLVEDVRMDAVRRLFRVVLFRIRQQNAVLREFEAQRPASSGGEGRRPHDTQRHPAASPEAAPPARNLVTPEKDHLPAASPFQSPLRHSPPPPRRPTLAVGEVAARLSWLDRFIVNGRPIGDLMYGEARGAKNLRYRDALFIEFLLSGVPPTSAMRIRDFVTPEEANALWNRAETEAETTQDAA